MNCSRDGVGGRTFHGTLFAPELLPELTTPSSAQVATQQDLLTLKSEVSEKVFSSTLKFGERLSIFY